MRSRQSDAMRLITLDAQPSRQQRRFTKIFLSSNKSLRITWTFATVARYLVVGPARGGVPVSWQHKDLELAGVSC